MQPAHHFHLMTTLLKHNIRKKKDSIVDFLLQHNLDIKSRLLRLN